MDENPAKLAAFMFLIESTGMIPADAMVAPRFVIIAGVRAECGEDAVKIVRVLEANVLFDQLHARGDAAVA